MHLLWRVTLALTRECVSMVTVAMVTWLWLGLHSDKIDFFGGKWGLFTSHHFHGNGHFFLLDNNLFLPDA